MGSACVSEKKKREITDFYAKKFDSFDFRVNQTDEFTFLDRARREITGLYGPEDFIQKIYNGYRRFMIENCFQIYLNKSKKDGQLLKSPLTPPPLVDEMWQLAILYTEKYRELCRELVGTTIHRVTLDRLNGFKNVFKSVWVDYNQATWAYDRDYTVWIYNKDVNTVVTKIYDYPLSLQEKDRIHINTKDLTLHLTNIRKYVEEIQTLRNLTREQPCTPPNDHPFYNRERREEVIKVLMRIKTALPVTLSTLVSQKFCTATSTQAYIDEYVRFMTLIYYTNTTLTPSEEIDQVWHMHQSLTIEYENFCNSIFGRLINHLPTVGGQADEIRFRGIYEQTLSFYRFIFRENPVIGLWPPTVSRFDPSTFVGSYISLLRVLQATMRVIEVHKTNRPQDPFSEIMTCYFTWTGRNLFSKKKYKINLKKGVKYRTGYTTGTYWVAGGCALIIGAGCGGGCGGGCGLVGCGGGIGCGGGCGGGGCSGGCGGSGCGGSGCGGSGCGGGGCGGGGCGGGCGGG